MHEVDEDINDPAFAVAMADRLHELIQDGGVTRDEALARLRAQVAAGEPIIGAGAGTGLSAKLAEAGGADLIIIYNSGRYRMGGRGSLAGLMPYGDANEIVVDMAREVLPVVRETPVLAGVCGTDPFRLMPVFLDELRRIGFSGVQNFPTVGLIDGTYPRRPRGDRHGLRPRGRHDPARARARLPDRARTSSTTTRRRRWRRPAPTCSFRTWA